jgi:hypothetical protein
MGNGQEPGAALLLYSYIYLRARTQPYVGAPSAFRTLPPHSASTYVLSYICPPVPYDSIAPAGVSAARRVCQVLICASVQYKHTTLGISIKKASIRIMRGEGGFLIQPRGFKGAGCILEYAKVKYWYYTTKRAAVLPGGQRQYAGGWRLL